MIILFAFLACFSEGVKKPGPKSSLFQSWAMAPYPYMQQQQQFAQQYMDQAGPYGPPRGPEYGYGGPQAWPPYPGGYYPMGYQNGPAPPPMYYYPQAPQPPQYPTYQVTEPSRTEYSAYPPRPAPAIGYQTPPVLLADPAHEKPSEAQAASPTPEVHAETVSTTASPMKVALSQAMNDAMKQMDKVTDSAVDLTSFDNLHYVPTQPPVKPVRLSLSEETVPLDSHILNWRELVGLPKSNSETDTRYIINENNTPMLSGQWDVGK